MDEVHHGYNVDTNIIHFPYDMDINFDLALSEYILQQMKKHSKNVAQIDSVTGKKETYVELLTRCISLAKTLKLKGVTTEDIIGICCYNNMDYVVAILASVFIGARFCSFNVSAAETEIIHCLKLVKPLILFCEHESEKMLSLTVKSSEINCEIVVFDQSDEFITMNQLLKKYETNEELKIDTSRQMKDTVGICFTSGTSGLSKGVQLKSFGFFHNAYILSKATPDSKTILIFSLPYWISNISFLFTGVINGLTRVIYKIFDKDTIIKVIQDWKVDTTIFTQTVINDLNKNIDVSFYDTPTLKYIFYGGSYIGLNQISELKKHFPSSLIVNGIAMTEMVGLLIYPNIYKTVIDENGYDSVGKPIPGMRYKVADLITEEPLGPNKKGELRIKSDGMMNGYLNQPEVTAAAFDEDGYLKTGDVVYYDKNLNFYVVDRIKEIFKYKTYHISPSIIEDILEVCPGVQEAAIIPVPHERDGELPMAVIVRCNNATLTEKDLIDYVKNKLSDIYQLRGGVRFVDKLPRTGTGKLRRKYLKELILNSNQGFLSG